MPLHVVSPLPDFVTQTEIGQGWPKFWANFRTLVGIFSQIVGPSLAIWANPVQFLFDPAEPWQVLAEASGNVESAEKAAKTARAFGVLERLQVRQPTRALPRSSIVSISY